MENLLKTNKGFDAITALRHISGRNLTINIIERNTGLNYGLVKVIVSVNSVFYLGIVGQKLIGLKIIGLRDLLNMRLIFQSVNTLFTMELISIRKGV